MGTMSQYICRLHFLDDMGIMLPVSVFVNPTSNSKDLAAALVARITHQARGSAMSVKFQVVGIFYSDEIEYNKIKTSTPGEPHLIDVMNAFKEKTKGASDLANFDFTRDSKDIFVIRLAIDHKVKFKGRTGIHYDPGIYQLSQDLTPGKNNAYTVWQYYLFDKDGRAMPVSGETPITQTKIPDGYKIVWRLVEICNGPSPIPKRLYSMAPAQDVLSKN